MFSILISGSSGLTNPDWAGTFKSSSLIFTSLITYSLMLLFSFLLPVVRILPGLLSLSDKKFIILTAIKIISKSAAIFPNIPLFFLAVFVSLSLKYFSFCFCLMLLSITSGPFIFFFEGCESLTDGDFD